MVKVFDGKHPGHFAKVDADGNIWHRRVCLVKRDSGIPGHPCIGDQRVTKFDGFFDVPEMLHFIEQSGMRPRAVDFSDIWYALYYAGEKERIMEMERFDDADTSFPGVITPIRNPGNKPFRLLDGRRRLWKMQAEGKIRATFYIMPDPKVFDFFWMLMKQDTHRQTLNRL